MSSPLLAMILVAVIWLAFWSVKDHSRPSKTWWMFAMREPGASKSNERQWRSRPGQSAPSRGKPVQQVWRRSGS
jgi:lysylphosphatidylglycerol synthetase-like protein (DUF2156 family)